MTKTMPAIKATRLSKRFDPIQALTNVSFEIKPGLVAALIGPNGSGKTTLLKILVGLYAPSKGAAHIAGHDIQTQPILAKKQIGYVPDNPEGFDYLSGREFLSLTASLKGITRKSYDEESLELLQHFHLAEILDQPMSTYSRGTRQKIAFVAAQLGKPKVLIIDEPIVGLDPESIEIFGEALKAYARRKGTVLFSTHILEFGKRFANHVLVMHHGRIKLNSKITNKTSLTKYYHKIVRN